VIHPKLKKLAVFGHFEGVVLDPGPARGDTVIVRLENKWFWLIPLSEKKTSVGCVMDQTEFARAKQSRPKFSQTFGGPAQSCGTNEGRKTGEYNPNYRDFSYYNRRLVGRGYCGWRRGRFHGPDFFRRSLPGHALRSPRGPLGAGFP